MVAARTSWGTLQRLLLIILVLEFAAAVVLLNHGELFGGNQPSALGAFISLGVSWILVFLVYLVMHCEGQRAKIQSLVFVILLVFGGLASLSALICNIVLVINDSSAGKNYKVSVIGLEFNGMALLINVVNILQYMMCYPAGDHQVYSQRRKSKQGKRSRGGSDLESQVLESVEEAGGKSAKRSVRGTPKTPKTPGDGSVRSGKTPKTPKSPMTKSGSRKGSKISSVRSNKSNKSNKSKNSKKSKKSKK
ncbi:unnamed protein product, partial [Mesorhabditis spiculigera]